MPSHPDRVRTAPLPEGYQFGDARHLGRIAMRFLKQWDIRKDVDLKDLRAWRPPHLNAAEQLAVRAVRHGHDFTRFDPAWMAYVCPCGARLDTHGDVTEPARRLDHWNVIEGEH